ncbi:unnamed protein product [Rangifer tarandus platyrhynchus]|uniref:Uncharacterized protein n=1 Tax=Rangifer tarandus platyrhynchus TaxID=3082113 RepID=A0ABN8YJH0_RANTA|nr:unnamed protein product [Rangifer tarandus platyrhynchus]
MNDGREADGEDAAITLQLCLDESLPAEFPPLHGDKTSRGGPGGRRPEALESWKGLSRRNNDHDVQRHSGPSQTCLGGLEKQESARSEHVLCGKHSVDIVKCTHSATLPGAMEEAWLRSC